MVRALREVPQISGVTSGTNGLQLSFTEPLAGTVYTVEASTNLVNWTKLMARTSAGAGSTVRVPATY